MHVLLYHAIGAMTATAIAISLAAQLRMYPGAPTREAAAHVAFAFTMLSAVLGALWPVTWIVLLCGYLVPTQER